MRKGFLSGVIAVLLMLIATVAKASVTITASGGWFESAYVEFSTDGSSYYNVYYSTNKSSWTKIDDQLVRKYSSSKGRADVLGITAGTYYIKVASVNSSGTETSNTVSGALTVKAHDRGGFAHFNWSKGVGAYTNSGVLKSGANILYITKSNAKTITMDVPSAATKTTSYTGLQTIIDAWTKAYSKGWSSAPLAIRVLGTLSYADMDKFSSSSEGIQIKGASTYADCPITFEGVGNDAVIHGFGFLIRNLSDFEMRNLAIMDCLDDCVSIDTSNSHIWVHNMDFFYGQAGSDSDQKKGDGTVDMKGDSKYITVSYNHFWDSGKSSLCGMKSESGPNYITYHHNWFDHSDSRHPRIRTMSVHVYNNYFDGNSKYGVGVTYGASCFVDRNYFRNCKYPMMSSMQGSDAAGDGTFSSENGGMIKAYGNYITGAKSLYVQSGYSSSVAEASAITNTASQSFDCYVVNSASTTVPSSYKTVQGGTTYDNFDTNSSLMYSYSAESASSVPTTVKGTYGAGRLQHGSYQYTFSSSEDDNYAVISALKSAVENYKSGSYYVGVTSSMYFKSGVITDSAVASGSTADDGAVDNSSTGSSDDNTSSGSSDDNTSSGTTTTVSTSGDVCSFTGSKPSMSSVTVTGNYATSKGSVTLNGVTYTTCVKMESSTSVKFTLSATTDVTFVFGGSTSAAGKAFKLNGTAYTLGSDGTLTKSLSAGTYTITKSASINLFAIVFAATAAKNPTITVGSYTTGKGYAVALSGSDSGASYYYSTDGSNYTKGTSFYATGCTVYAYATLGTTSTKSGVVTKTVSSAPYATTPTITATANSDQTQYTVTITSESGATIYYTTDGSTPTTSSSKYSSALTITSSCTVKALAVASNKENSSVASKSITVQQASSTDTGSGTTTASSSDVCSFTGSKPSMSSVTVTGNYSTAKGSVTYGGVTYTTCVKMESSTKIVFTLSAETDVTFVFGGSTSAASKQFKLNGTAYTLGSDGTLTKTLSAGTYTITKSASINLFAIAFAAQAQDPTTWNFSEFTSTVILTGSNYNYSYNGLTLVGNTSSTYTSDYVSKNGFRCNGASSSSIRHIKYTPTANGTLTVKFASNNTSDTNRTSAIGTAVGSPIVTASAATGTMTANVTAGTTYYIYFVSGGQTIKSITMTPGATANSLSDLEFEATAINAVEAPAQGKQSAGKKCFIGGKLVIIKDGKTYSLSGQQID